MPCAVKAAEQVAARVNAAARDSSQPRASDDASSAVSLTLPAAPVAADARGESPRANDEGSQVQLICSGKSTVGPTRGVLLGRPGLAGRPNTSLQTRLDQVLRLVVTTRVCLVRRMRTLDHPPHLLLHFRRSTMACAIMMASLVVPRLTLVPRRRL